MDAVAKPVQEWQRRKTIKAEGDLELKRMNAEALIEAAKNGQKIEADWDKRVQEQMRNTWKDEVLMLVFVVPFVCCFIPEAQPYIERGFTFLDAHTPTWYVVILLGIVAATFGLRWLVAPIVGRMMNKK